MPIIAATLVFMFGFFTMNLFWFLGEWNPDLHGLYFFKSATIGDAIVLPAVTYLGLKITEGEKYTQRQKLIIAIMTILGTLGGIYSQYQWLSSAQTTLNWTIPEKHTFNSAGWYHAVFLCTMTGAFSGIASAVLISTIKAKHRGESLGAYHLKLLILLPAFMILNFNDFSTIETDPDRIISNSIIPALTAILIPFLIEPRKIRNWLLPSITSSTFWIALVFLYSYWQATKPFTLLLYLGFLLLSAMFQLPLLKIIDQGYVKLSILLNASATVWIVAIGNWYQAKSRLSIPDIDLLIYCGAAYTLASIGIMIFTLSSSPHLDQNRNVIKQAKYLAVRTIQSTLITLFVPLFGLILYLNVDSPAFEAYTVLWSVFATLGLLFMKGAWSEFTLLEDEAATYWGTQVPDDLSERIKLGRLSIWGWSIPILIDMIIMYGASDIKVIKLQTSSDVANLSYYWETLFLIIFIFLIPWASKLVNHKGTLLYATTFPTLLLAVLEVLRLRLLLGHLSDHGNSFFIALSIILPTLSILGFSYASIYYNVFQLRGSPKTSVHYVLPMQVALFTSSITLFAVTTILSFSLHGTLVAIGAIAVLILYPRVTLRYIDNQNWDEHITITSTKDGITQDALHTSVLSLIVILYPSLVLLSSIDLATALVRILSLFGILVVVLQWTLGNNTHHLRRTQLFLARNPQRALRFNLSPDEFSRRFSRHLRTQNICACIMLIPLIPVLLSEVDLEIIDEALSMPLHS